MTIFIEVLVARGLRLVTGKTNTVRGFNRISQGKMKFTVTQIIH